MTSHLPFSILYGLYMQVFHNQWLIPAVCSLVLSGLFALAQGNLASGAANNNDAGRTTLSSEVASNGWIAFSQKTERGDWDLVVMRPDGSNRRKLTDTPEYNEAGVRFSPDGKKILYYRMRKNEPVANNTYGKYDLVIAGSDGQNSVVYGSEFPWACWGPNSDRIAILTPKGIQIVDLATRKVVKQLPRKGIVQQLVWSPDGKWFLGTANGLGPFWNIGRLNAETGEINAVSEVDRYNCTPDWAPDSNHVVYARGIIPEKGGQAQCWIADGDGKNKQMLFAEAGRHVYGACVSPDGKYLLFTRSEEDMGDKDSAQTTMTIIRRSDAPMLGDQAASLQYPNASHGPFLELGKGWEPHWINAELTSKK
jgi:Tol biopolymer transport system component